MYSLLGRIILSFFAPPDWKNYIWRAFVRITDPVVRLVRFMTPAVLPDILVLVFRILLDDGGAPGASCPARKLKSLAGHFCGRRLTHAAT